MGCNPKIGVLLSATAIASLAFINVAKADVFFYTADSSNTSIQTIGLVQGNLGNTVLSNPTSLAPGSNHYNYSVILFTPTISGTYSFGQTQSPSDTIMVLYNGIFDPISPGSGALIGNDDTSATVHEASIGSAVAVQCGPSTNYCPRVTWSVTAGQTYSLLVSSFSTSYNGVFAVPFEFYSTGSVVFGQYTGRTPIDLAQSFYMGSQLGVTVDPIFVGGTLRLDQSGGLYPQDFTLASMLSNTIDQNGSNSVFAGVLSDAVAGSPGHITIDNSLTGGSVTFTGINTYTGSTILKNGTLSVSQDANLGDSLATLVFDGGTLRATDGFSSARSVQLASTGAIEVVGGTILTLAGEVTGGGAWTKTGEGTLLLSGNNTYTGTTTVEMGVLKAGAAGAFGPASGFVIENGGTLDLDGYGQTISGLNNNGTVQLSSPLSSGPVGTVLTVGGNYVGNNGNLYLRAALNDDNSTTDRLILNGGAQGTTLVNVVNAGGGGAQTTGDGILIIQTTSSSPTAFSLSGRAAAGAYNYTMYYGGNVATGGNPNDQNWYLRSTLQVTDTDGGASTGIPDYRSEFPLMTSVTSVASEYGYAMLGTLHERVGNIWPIAVSPTYEERTVRDRNGKKDIVRVPFAKTGAEKKATSGWARVIGDRGFKNSGNFERRGSEYNYTFAAIQAGLDVFGREQSNGTLDKAGFYIGYGNIDVDVKGAWYGKAGTIDMDAFTLGAYWTHKASQGWYTDAVVQGTWYSTEANSIEGQRLKPDGFGITASLEGGYNFNIGNGLTLEPQAQIVYQNVSFDAVSDAYGRFKLSDQESLRGRLGLRVAKTWNAAADGAKPRLINAWMRANIWHEFMGNSTTTAYGLNGMYSASASSSLGGTWGEIGAGISGQVSDTVGRDPTITPWTIKAGRPGTEDSA